MTSRRALILGLIFACASAAAPARAAGKATITVHRSPT